MGFYALKQLFSLRVPLNIYSLLRLLHKKLGWVKRRDEGRGICVFSVFARAINTHQILTRSDGFLPLENYKTKPKLEHVYTLYLSCFCKADLNKQHGIPVHVFCNFF